LRDSTLAIQNARFDTRVLDAELSRSGQPSLAGLNVRIVDTLEVSRSLFPLRAKHSLDAICDRVDVDRAGRADHHGALVDARLLAETLPKFAREYDAWCALAEAGCASELDRFERAFYATLGDARDPIHATTPERADRAVGRIAAAQSWMRRWEDYYAARAEMLVGADGWCCKHFAARWTSSRNVSWKDAAAAHLSTADLNAFRTESSTRVLTPRPDGALAAALSALDAELSASAIADSLACVARAAVLLREAHAALDAARTELRTALLHAADAGYALRHATLRDSTRSPIDYKAAVDALAPGADIAPFTTSRVSLHIAARNTFACAALFG
jgi:DNA polymerase III epsilon subunit-like protein